MRLVQRQKAFWPEERSDGSFAVVRSVQGRFVSGYGEKKEAYAHTTRKCCEVRAFEAVLSSPPLLGIQRGARQPHVRGTPTFRAPSFPASPSRQAGYYNRDSLQAQ